MKKIISLVCCAAMLMSCLSGLFQVSADDTVLANVESAFATYVAEKKNNVDPALLDEYINEKLAGAATVTVVDSFRRLRHHMADHPEQDDPRLRASHRR